MPELNIVTEVFIWIIVPLAAVSGVIAFLEALGFLPSKWAKWIARNRLSFSVELLKEMGVTFAPGQLGGASQSLPTLASKLREATIQEKVSVGKIESANFEEFIDLQGATTKHETAIFFARELTTYLRKTKSFLDSSRAFTFDFVACPKDGSPILAYELSRLVKRPLILHPTEEKFRSPSSSVRARFDIACSQIDAGSKVLIVDDSTTGARKVMELINDLREFKFVVENCVVVFEPVGKEAREKLAHLGVKLHSIHKGPQAIDG